MELNGWASPQMLRRYGASARSARAAGGAGVVPLTCRIHRGTAAAVALIGRRAGCPGLLVQLLCHLLPGQEAPGMHPYASRALQTLGQPAVPVRRVPKPSEDGSRSSPRQSTSRA